MRSKVLLVSNIVASVYAIFLLWYFGGACVSAGGVSFIEYWKLYFNFVYDFAGFSSASVNIIYALLALLGVHICTFVLGAIVGWIGYIAKKSGAAKFAAVMYLLGTICFPIYIMFGLPILILGFVGSSKQKQLNLSAAAE